MGTEAGLFAIRADRDYVLEVGVCGYGHRTEGEVSNVSLDVGKPIVRRCP